MKASDWHRKSSKAAISADIVESEGDNDNAALADINGKRLKAEATVGDSTTSAESIRMSSMLLGKPPTSEMSKVVIDDSRYQEIRELVRRDYEELRIKTMAEDRLFWNSLQEGRQPPHSVHHFRMTINFCRKLAPKVVGLEGTITDSKGSSLNVIAILGFGWICEQQRLGKPLRLIHPSLPQSNANALVEQLLELFNVDGTVINLYDPLIAERKEDDEETVLTVTRFTIETQH